MASSFITTYTSAGLAASRPASPSVPAGVFAMYYATDTGKLSVYTAGAWITLN